MTNYTLYLKKIKDYELTLLKPEYVYAKYVPYGGDAMYIFHYEFKWNCHLSVNRYFLNRFEKHDLIVNENVAVDYIMLERKNILYKTMSVIVLILKFEQWPKRMSMFWYDYIKYRMLIWPN